MVSDHSSRQSPSKYTNENESDNSRMSRCRQKLLCELDTLRRQNCQGKICNLVVRVQQSSLTSVREKCDLQEKVWLATQKKYLKEEEELCHKLHKEEEESRRRQELLVIEHEQHAKFFLLHLPSLCPRNIQPLTRVSEIGKIIINVEERERENEEKNKQMILYTSVLTEKCHILVMEYRTIYEKFLEHLKSCKDKKALGERCSSLVTKLKHLSELMNVRIQEKCKNISVTEDDLQVCSNTIEEANNIVKQIEVDIEIVNKEFDTNLLDMQIKADSGTSVKQQIMTNYTSCDNTANMESSAVSSSSTSDDTSAIKDYVNEDSYKRYVCLMSYHEKFSKTYENLVKDVSMKKFRFDCQKAVNTPVNAICPISAAHLQDKFSKLQKLLSGSTVEMGRSHFSAAQHPQGIAFCKDLLAKKFVAQGETTVSCKPEAAFAIAAVIVALWSEFPDFGQLLLSHFYKECPYLVPYFKPRIVDQSDPDYYKSLGYRYLENDEVEKQDKFLKRMSGIMHLYSAIIITPLKRNSSKPHPLGVGEAWRWVACVINLDPRPDICATLLYEFLEVVGHSMFNNYGQIFQKLLHLLCTEYYHKLEEVTPKASRGPVARLESFLQKNLKLGRINPPAGMLPIEFW